VAIRFLIPALATCLPLTLGSCSKQTPKERAPAASASAVSALEAPKPAGPLKVAFVYVGPVGSAGGIFAHDDARKEAEASLGGRVRTSFVENVAEADAERALRDLVTQGNTLIFGTSPGYAAPMLKVAADSKDVKFEQAGGHDTADNLRSYDLRSYEGAYLAGIIAGALTKTKTLGFVAPVPSPDVIRNIDSFTLGAQSQNPSVKTKVAWVGRWFDPPKETEAAQALLQQGADVLMQSTESTAVVQAAEKAGKLALGWGSDMSELGLSAHLASAVLNWTPYYKKAMEDALDGTWKVDHTWWGARERAIDVVGYSAKVPVTTQVKVAEMLQSIQEGYFAIWKGPIRDQAGKERLKAGETADEKMLSGIDFYVRGVEGELPARK
jgi:simple sugar transport system substrate-binding protein